MPTATSISLFLAFVVAVTGACGTVRLRRDASSDGSADGSSAETERGRDPDWTTFADGGDDGPAALPPRVCLSPFRDSWTFSLGTGSTPWKWAFGNPRVDTLGELVLTFDDIVVRQPLSGGWTLSFDLSFDGDVTFLAAASGGYENTPSITRLGQTLTLSGAHYGGRRLEGAGAFQGKQLPDQQLRVTVYGKSARREIAMRVEAGGVVHRSGFVLAGDVSVPVFLGNNDRDTSPTFTGASESGARLGPLEGCMKLTDDEVQAAHDR